MAFKINISNKGKTLKVETESESLVGRKIGEKVSLLRKIERGKMTPNQTLTKKLEHALKIRLLAPASESKAPIPPSSRSQPVTLGELISLKVKEAEVAKEREPS